MELNKYYDDINKLKRKIKEHIVIIAVFKSPNDKNTADFYTDELKRLYEKLEVFLTIQCSINSTEDEINQFHYEIQDIICCIHETFFEYDEPYFDNETWQDIVKHPDKEKYDTPSYKPLIAFNYIDIDLKKLRTVLFDLESTVEEYIKQLNDKKYERLECCHLTTDFEKIYKALKKF